jgi:hypothetical protein
MKKITKINHCPKGRETFKIPLEQVRLRTDQGAFHRNDWGDLTSLALSQEITEAVVTVLTAEKE